VQFRDSLFGQDDLFETTKPGLEMDMAAPKLRMGQQDTGLEGLFNSVFSLSDEPNEVRNGQANGQTGANGNKTWFGVAFWTLVIAAFCSVGVSIYLMSSSPERNTVFMDGQHW